MRPVVFVSSSRFPAAPDRLTDFVGGLVLILAVVAAGISGWQSGGPVWGILFGLVTLVTFPFLLTFGAILFLALYPVLAWPGSWIANQLGWTFDSPHYIKRIWLQRASVVVLLIPLLALLQRNAVSVMGLIAGIAAFGLLLLGMLLMIPVLLLTGLFLYALTRKTQWGPRQSADRWTPPDPPRLPPPST